MASELERLYLDLYFDENVALYLAALLQKEGYDVVTAHSARMLGKSDQVQFEFAVSQRRTIVTHNRDDYTNIHTAWLLANRKHFGIIILIQRLNASEIGKRLLEFMNNVTPEEMENQLRFV
jgi:predicted nuclease of predicted toxin-antitoxin system